MAVIIDGTNGITSVNGTAAAPSVTGADTDTGIVYGTNTLSLATGGTTAVTVDSSQNVGIGTSSPANPLTVERANGGNYVATFQNTTTATPYGVWIKDPTSSASGYPLLTVGNSTGSSTYLRVDSGTGNVLINNGYGSAATAYGCRAWVNFNGTGTVAIRASGNVSSITDNGTGDYTINFTAAMPDANYSVEGSSQFNGSSSNGTGNTLITLNRIPANALTASNARIMTICVAVTGTIVDCFQNCVTIHR